MPAEASLVLVDHGDKIREDSDSDNEMASIFRPSTSSASTTTLTKPPQFHCQSEDKENSQPNSQAQLKALSNSSSRNTPPQFQNHARYNGIRSSAPSSSFMTPVISAVEREPMRTGALFKDRMDAGDIFKKLQELITSMSAISHEQVTLRLLLGNMDKKLDSLLTAQGSGSRLEELEDLVKSPLRDVNEFQDLEKTLSNSTTTQDQFKKQVDSYGGNDLQMKVNRMMICLFLPPLAVKFTHFGMSRKGKECFNTTFTCKLMKRVLISRKYQEAEIDGAFVEFFRRSGERLKAFQKKGNNGDPANSDNDYGNQSDQG